MAVIPIRMTPKIKVSMTLPPILYERYRKFCKRKGYKISTRIAILIDEDMIKTNKDDDFVKKYFGRILKDEKNGTTTTAELEKLRCSDCVGFCNFGKYPNCKNTIRNRLKS